MLKKFSNWLDESIETKVSLGRKVSAFIMLGLFAFATIALIRLVYILMWAAFAPFY